MDQAAALGDLRILRKCIVHEAGNLSEQEHAKLKVMGDLCKANEVIGFTHDQMHKVFVHVKQAIGRLILEYTAQLPGAPEATDLVSVAIQHSKPP